jgi:hypothetical protein
MIKHWGNDRNTKAKLLAYFCEQNSIARSPGPKPEVMTNRNMSWL